MVNDYKNGPETVKNFKRENEDDFRKSNSSEFKISTIRREIEVDESKLLGRGSGGTCIFEGRFHGRIVAVKRMII